MASSWMERLTEKDGLLLENQKLTRRFLAEGNNVSVVHVQYHFFCVWQMETCHGLGEVARRTS